MRPSKLSRKSALKPGSKGLARGQLKRTAFKSGSSAAIPTTSLHAVSTRTFGKKGSAKRAEQVRRKQVREAVYARDLWTCQFPHASFPKAPKCWPQALTPHHRKKSGQQGEYTEANLVTCCAPANDWIEEAVGADRDLLIGLRWVVLSWEQQ